MLTLKFKKLHKKAELPFRATVASAGVDLTPVSVEYDEIRNLDLFSFGLAVEIPSNYVGLLLPRSSTGITWGLHLANTCGIIDSDYRGEIKAYVNRRDTNAGLIGLKAFQLIILPCPQVFTEFADELSTTARGIGGFGSTTGEK